MVLGLTFAFILPVAATAQQTRITALTVDKKPGAQEGRVTATVVITKQVAGHPVSTTKTGHIAKHALAAWPILQGEGVLLLLGPARNETQYRLRYYDADAGKSRLLGTVPFSTAHLTETAENAPDWAFALAGRDSSGHSVIYAGNTDAIHAYIRNASHPQFRGDSLHFHMGTGESSRKISVLMGEDVQGVIFSPQPGYPEYLQFQPNGTSLLFRPGSPVQRGRWILENDGFHVTANDAPETTWPLRQLHRVAGIPASTILSIRLLQPLSSLQDKRGMEIKAVSLTPAISNDAILIPQGTEFDGKIIAAHGVGWGIKHETAALTLRFEKATLPDGRTLPIDAWVYKVDNAREAVTGDGKIQGIRSTGTIGHSAENQLTALAQVDPIAYIFLGTSGPAVLGFADPEILYNAGTDLLVQFHEPVITDVKYQPHVPHDNLDPAQTNQLTAIVKSLPFRTKTEIGAKDSDLTNLVFIGDSEALRRAFMAAGWTTSDALTSAATFQTVKTLTGNQTYTQAPMSTLLLNGAHPVFTLQKTTNTFSSRHHVRVFPTDEKLNGEPVLTASSTQDIGIAFSRKQKTFIHVIDQYLDNERSKIINDLDFTGCVTAVDMVDRPWVPQNAYNSTGDRLRTDGKVAVLYLNSCRTPHTTPDTVAHRADLFQRSERNTALTVKDTVYRGNLIYQGIAGGFKVHSYLQHQGELGENNGNWRLSDASGTQYTVHGAGPSLWARPFQTSEAPTAADRELAEAARKNILRHRWDPPRFEIALNGGYSRYRNNFLEVTLVELKSSNVNNPDYLIGLGDGVWDGWAAGVSLTLNSWNYISNEFSYMREQTKFDLVEFSTSTGPQDPSSYANIAGLTTRRFAYNTVFNLRPRKSRFRPYVDAGPAFQLIALNTAPLKKPSGYFRLGLSNIGLIKAAFDFGNTPPLNGGGVFQPALQYGGGLKYRVMPHLMLRGDYQETWSKNPSIIRDSYEGYIPDGLDDTYTTTVTNTKPPASYIQWHSTLGVAFTF